MGELPTEDTAGSRFKSPVTAVALSNCELYALRASDFEQAAAADHEVQEQLAKAASRWAQVLVRCCKVEGSNRARRRLWGHMGLQMQG